MDIAEKTIWQQAAGDTDRNYADLCLRWDVVLNGPGYAGQWPNCEKPLRSDEWSSRKVTDLRRFAEEMKDGDLVVLRIGTSTVLGVGKLSVPMNGVMSLGDIDGWDLQHVAEFAGYGWTETIPKRLILMLSSKVIPRKS